MKIALFFLILVIALSACAPPNPVEGTPNEETGNTAGFFHGLWDGFTAVIAFVLHLFGADYNIYNPNNNGGWYNFGYLIGIGAFCSIPSTASRRR